MSNTFPAPDFSNCRATDVLRFVILRATLYKYKSAHLSTLAKKSGIRADMLTRYISTGLFTTDAANIIEKTVGRDVIHWEWLVNPVVSAERGDIF